MKIEGKTIRYLVELDAAEYSLVGRALASLAGHRMNLRSGDTKQAEALNRRLLELRSSSIRDEMRSVEDALQRLEREQAEAATEAKSATTKSGSTLTELQTYMAALDCALTGKAELARHGFGTVEQWFGDSEGCWYLSDGGYSRVVCAFQNDCQLGLASVSRQEVRDRWDGAVKEREAAEEVIRKQWRLIRQKVGLRA
jgi:hypothetical protein